MSIATGRIAWWKFDEAPGTRADTTGSNHLTEEAGAIPQSIVLAYGKSSIGPFSTSFLTRTDADLSSTFPGKTGGTGTAFTLSLMFYVPTGGAATQQLLTKTSGKIEAWWDSTEKFYFYVGGKQITLSGATVDAWHHAVCTYDGTVLYGYLDTVRSAGQVSVGAYTSTDPFVVGGFTTALHDYPFQGYVDDFVVFDRALSATEVSLIYTYGMAVAEFADSPSQSQGITYDAMSSDAAGDDFVDLTGFVTEHTTPSTTTNSQAITTDQYRTMTLSLSQHQTGVISGQLMVWSIQVSNDGVTWYQFVEAFGNPVWVQNHSRHGEKSFTGTAAAPAKHSYPIPCATPYTRVKVVTDAIVDEGANITISLARVNLSPQNLTWD